MEQFFEEKIFWHVTQTEMIHRVCLFCQTDSYTAPCVDAGDVSFKDNHQNCKPRKLRKKIPETAKDPV